MELLWRCTVIDIKVKNRLWWPVDINISYDTQCAVQAMENKMGYFNGRWQRRRNCSFGVPWGEGLKKFVSWVRGIGSEFSCRLPGLGSVRVKVKLLNYHHKLCFLHKIILLKIIMIVTHICILALVLAGPGPHIVSLRAELGHSGSTTYLLVSVALATAHFQYRKVYGYWNEYISNAKR